MGPTGPRPDPGGKLVALQNVTAIWDEAETA